MADGLSLRDFGRQIGVTGEAVRKAIADGKIPSDCVGKRIVGKGKEWPVIIDPARAAEHWGRNRDPNQVRDKAAMSAGAKRGWAQRRGEDPPDDEPEDDDTPTTGERKKGEPSINDYKRITEAYKARMAKLDYEERAGKLVNADQVKIGYINMVTAARNKLLGVPSKAKGRIPHLTVRDIEILEDLIADALSEIAAND